MQSSIKKLFTIALAAVAVVLSIAGFSLYQLSSASTHLELAQAARYNSYLLADEMRQSSDDLTRLARTYVVTGDPRWEQQYQEILDIRNGSKPRPNQYEKIYWDFRAADIDPGKGTSAAIELKEKEKEIILHGDAEFQLQQIDDVLRGKLTKRGVDARFLDVGKVRNGISTEDGKKIQQVIKGSKLKVQGAIQGDAVRVTGGKRDDLQAAMALIRSELKDLPLSFNNFRD